MDLSAQQGNVDPYKVLEMMDFLNSKVFQVFNGIDVGRKIFIFEDNDDRERFALTINKSNKKEEEITEQPLDNVSKAIDIYLNSDHGRKVLRIDSMEEFPSTTMISSDEYGKQLYDQKVTDRNGIEGIPVVYVPIVMLMKRKKDNGEGLQITIL